MLIDRCSALRATNLFQSNGTFEILYSQSISSCQIQFLKNNFIGLIKETNITKPSKQCKFCIYCLDKSFDQSGLSEWFSCQGGQGNPWARALRWSGWFRWSRWSLTTGQGGPGGPGGQGGQGGPFCQCASGGLGGPGGQCGQP